MAPAALFLAAKVEEQPKKLEHVIKVAHTCLHPQESLPDTRSEPEMGFLCVAMTIDQVRLEPTEILQLCTYTSLPVFNFEN